LATVAEDVAATQIASHGNEVAVRELRERVCKLVGLIELIQRDHPKFVERSRGSGSRLTILPVGSNGYGEYNQEQESS
jgi:hypothetical protein